MKGLFSRSRARHCGALALAGLLLGAGGAAAEETGETLRDENVVLLFVSGTPTDDLIERIRSSNVDFDLSDEMLEELRVAGLPSRLIEAMVARQNELHPEGPPAPEPEPAGPTLTVRLNPDWQPKKNRARPRVRVLDALDPQTRQQLQIRTPDARFTELAVVLLCRTAEHVPDHWRSQSPLGRDFVFTPRHRVLTFLPGTQWEKAGKLRRFASKGAVLPGDRDSVAELGILNLEVPSSIAATLEPQVGHDLVLGVAVQAADRYYLVVSDMLDGVVLDDSGLELTAEIKGGKDLHPAQIDVEFLETTADSPPNP